MQPFPARLALPLAALAILPAPAPAQQDGSALLRPIVAEVRDAGTLHLGTGTWTRRAAPSAALAGPTVLYANTCPSGYFATMVQNERWTDEGVVPGATMPTTPSTAIPGGYDTASGCQSSHSVDGFQIAYCTNSNAFDLLVTFQSAYQAPTTVCTPPGTPTASFPLNGLPASNGLVQACWIVSVDLGGQSFDLAGSDGADGNAFGWSTTLTSPPVASNTDGVLVKGGAPVGTSYATCTGTDATRWDRGTASVAYPANVAQSGGFPDTQESGTGMLTQDAFRIDGPTSAPSGPGCYFFGGGAPLASFHLELYSNTVFFSCLGTIGQTICLPGQNGVIACPCGNAPTNGGAGCNNSTPTGGGLLQASSTTGIASVSNDQVTLTATFVRPNATSLFLQGNGLIAAGAVFGDGVRCAGGQLLRLNAPTGTTSDAGGTVVYPNAGFPQSITARAAQLGQPIAPGDTRWYQVYYRDPLLTFCPNPPGNSWNVTAAVQLTWVP